MTPRRTVVQCACPSIITYQFRPTGIDSAACIYGLGFFPYTYLSFQPLPLRFLLGTGTASEAGTPSVTHLCWSSLAATAFWMSSSDLRSAKQALPVCRMPGRWKVTNEEVRDKKESERQRDRRRDRLTDEEDSAFFQPLFRRLLVVESSHEDRETLLCVKE